MRNESWNGALLILLIMVRRVASSLATRKRARCSVCHMGNIATRGGEDAESTGASFVGFFAMVIRQEARISEEDDFCYAAESLVALVWAEHLPFVPSQDSTPCFLRF